MAIVGIAPAPDAGTKVRLHSLVCLDDGREAVCIGNYGDAELDIALVLMFADGSTLHDVAPERASKLLGRMPSDQGAHPKPWPSPWQEAILRLRSDVQTNTSRTAPPLPPPSADTQKRISARLAALKAERCRREGKAWRCESTPEALLKEALAGEEPHVIVFDEWVTLKATRPAGEITFYVAGQYHYTFHADARRVSELVEIPVTRARALAKRGPQVLEFYEFEFYSDRVALALTAAGERVAFVRTRPEPCELVFGTEDEVRAYVSAAQSRHRQEAISAMIQRTGGAQLPLFEGV